MTKDELMHEACLLAHAVSTPEALEEGLVWLTQAYVDRARALNAGIALPPYVSPEHHRPIMVPCPTCSGDGWASHEDRHARTAKDVCPTCKDAKVIPAATGTSAKTSAPVATPDPADVAAEAKRYLKA